MVQQKCENCEFFVQYYIKRHNSFKKMLYGHCNRITNPKFKHKMSDYVCKHWKDNSILKEERAKSIRKTLYEIADHLIDIGYILKDEEDLKG